MSGSRTVLRLFLPDVPPGAGARLQSQIPGLVLTPLGFEIPLVDSAPEEILSLMIRYGVTARATRIVTKSIPPG